MHTYYNKLLHLSPLKGSLAWKMLKTPFLLLPNKFSWNCLQTRDERIIFKLYITMFFAPFDVIEVYGNGHSISGPASITVPMIKKKLLCTLFFLCMTCYMRAVWEPRWQISCEYWGCCCFCGPEAKNTTYFICLSRTHLLTNVMQSTPSQHFLLSPSFSLLRVEIHVTFSKFKLT